MVKTPQFLFIFCLFGICAFGPSFALIGDKYDCLMRESAYSFAEELMPQRIPLLSVFDALQLSSLCNYSRPQEDDNAWQEHVYNRFSKRAAALQDRQIFVDIMNGNDKSNNGTIQYPFKTIEKAISVVRGKKFYCNLLGLNIILPLPSQRIEEKTTYTLQFICEMEPIVWKIQ